MGVEYRGDAYLVRDNGAVYRRSRQGKRVRELDEVWTFGRPDRWSGYMHIGSHVVHRIVAIAFHGEQPSDKHIVDHIDTNRRNNRAENLRWITRLENLLLNPITLRRIITVCGSLDAFFEDPATLKGRDPNFDWMRTVSKEEAEESRKRLLSWAESGQIPKGGQLGEWVYGTREARAPALEIALDQESLSPMVVQRNWRTPTEFPICPDSIGADPLGEYADRLKPGVVFSRNTFGESLTAVAVRADGLLVVLNEIPSGIKEWAVTKITVENGKFVHEAIRTYFTLEGALNDYCELAGIGRPFDDSIDDYC